MLCSAHNRLEELLRILAGPEQVSEVLTICRTEAPGRRDHGQRGTAVQRADIVHVGVNVWMWGVKG